MSTALIKKDLQLPASEGGMRKFLRRFEAGLKKNFGGLTRTLAEMGYGPDDWDLMIETFPQFETIRKGVVQMLREDAVSLIIARSRGQKTPKEMDINDRRASLQAAKMVLDHLKPDVISARVGGAGGLRVEINLNTNKSDIEAEKLKEADFRIRR